jgi:hypothetical protein
MTITEVPEKTYEVAAQFAHFFTSAFLVSQFGRLGFKWLFASVVGMVAFAAVKEFAIDKNETSKLDFYMYLAGTSTAVLLYFV